MVKANMEAVEMKENHNNTVSAFLIQKSIEISKLLLLNFSDSLSEDKIEQLENSIKEQEKLVKYRMNGKNKKE